MIGANIASNILISSNKINVTQPSVGFNPFVASRAQMHYVSPLAKVVSTIGLVSADFELPMTVTNNQNTPMTQLLPNTHWYATTELSFIFNTDGINEQVINSVNNSILFPNPAKDNASVLINLKANTTVDLKIMNLIGGVVKTTSYSAVNGENELSLNLEGLSSGIYLVNIKVGGASSTKKLIIE